MKEFICKDKSDNIAYYNRGVAAGKNTTDPNSPNYKAGYNAGTAASKVGTATADKVLSGYTFTSAAGVGITGTMVNRGTLNWNPTSGTTQTVQPGYYSGGTLDSSGAYAQGYVDGQQQVTQNLQISYTYHSHEGNSDTGTGCYNIPVYHQHISSCGYSWSHFPSCPGDDPNTNRCPNNCSILNASYSCGKSTSVIESYSLGCGKTTSTVETATITY